MWDFENEVCNIETKQLEQLVTFESQGSFTCTIPLLSMLVNYGGLQARSWNTERTVWEQVPWSMHVLSELQQFYGQDNKIQIKKIIVQVTFYTLEL